MNILIISEDYPSDENRYAMSYIHSRNLIYKDHFSIMVVNFKALKNYTYEGIKVITLQNFINEIKDVISFDILISHAPNIKNHVKFIRKYKSNFNKIVFFIHGHEVLPFNKYYPKSYKYNNSIIKNGLRFFYDIYKLFTLSKIFGELSKDKMVKFIFVSSWMRVNFLKNINIDKNYIIDNSKIINNASNNIFIENNYKFREGDKLADFITIRPFDNPKYGVDLVVKFAQNNPNKTFHIYGKGDYFKFNKIPKNVTIIDSYIEQKYIPALLDKYKCALMPTRLDSQGVMVCEIATYGMPCITSDLPICLEMLNDFPNVVFISNEDWDSFFSDSVLPLKDDMKLIPDKFHNTHTVNKEIEYIKNLF